MNCIIVDDVPMARRGMKRLVESREELTLTGMFDSAEEALKMIREGDVQLVFLDIRMEGMSGIDLAREIGGEVMVVFTTAYSEYAVESYELDVVDYLVKPIDPMRFEMAVDKALARSREKAALRSLGTEMRGTEDFLTVKSERRYVRIRLEDILYVEGSKDFVVFQLTDGRVVSRLTVKGVEEVLPTDRFMRVNKSYIVNIEKITSFDNNDILIGRYEISIGPTYREVVLGRLLG